MIVRLKRKKAEEDGKYSYQLLNYEIHKSEVDERSLAVFANILKWFAEKSNGEFKYCITEGSINDDEETILNRKILYGENFWSNNKNQ